MARIAMIIPTWDGQRLLSMCLAAVQRQTYRDFETIVVDNGSQDRSLEFLLHQYPWVRLLRFAQNRGFAAGVNAGIRHSRSFYVVLLNNDTKPKDHWLAELVGVLEKKRDIDAVAGKMVQMEDPHVIDNAGDKMNTVGQADAIGRGTKDIGQYSQPREILSVCGGAAIYRRSVFEKIGFFDEHFTSFFEDVDLGLRMRLSGCHAWYHPRAVVHHGRGVTAMRLGKRREYLHFRNTWMLVMKNFPTELFFRRGRWWKMPLVFLHTVKYFTTHGMGREAGATILSLVVALPRIMSERARIQKNRVVRPAMLEQWMEEKHPHVPWQKKVRVR